MALVEGLRWKALDDVYVADFEGLDDGAEGEELEGCGRRHGSHFCMVMGNDWELGIGVKIDYLQR